MCPTCHEPHLSTAEIYSLYILLTFPCFQSHFPHFFPCVSLVSEPTSWALLLDKAEWRPGICEGRAGTCAQVSSLSEACLQGPGQPPVMGSWSLIPTHAESPLL